MTTEPAFPNDINRYGDLPQYMGITIRDYFAAAALPALLDKADDTKLTGGRLRAALAGAAYLVADAMMAAREPKPDVAGFENYKRETALFA